VAVCFPRPGSPVRHQHVRRDALALGQVRQTQTADALPILCVGQPVPGHEVVVSDAEGAPVQDGQVGHVLVRGPSVMDGYFEDPQRSSEVLKDGWLWTGDLGYLDEGGLYVTGRVKDLLIVRGKNHYAEDLEAVAERVPGVRGGGAVAFGVYDEAKATDVAVLVCETKLRGSVEQSALAARVAEAISEDIGVRVDEVVMVSPGAIPKTSSGKKQRALSRERYLKGALQPSKSSALGVARAFARSGAGFISLLGKRWLRQRRAPP
jgi:fatty-acyl-CoA synthase